MDAALEEEINLALHSTIRRISLALVQQAGEIHALGGMTAYHVLGMTPNFNMVSESAMNFADNYKTEIMTFKGTMIKGEMVPWLKDRTMTEKEQIAEIIKKGIAEGKPYGAKELKKGGYAKGTIAADLAEHFDKYKSQASKVARTETSTIINRGQLDSWGNIGITAYKVLDNEGPNSCKECGDVNGQYWSKDYAYENPKEHPNCIRTFAPKPYYTGALDEE